MSTFQRVLAIMLASVWLGLVCAPGGAAPPPLLLADDSRFPRITISWPVRESSRGGGGAGEQEITLRGVRPYRAPGDERPLGRNISAYVGLGGTRVHKGVGHPDGATVLVGFYKVNTRRPFFDSIADGAEVTVTLDQIYMNQEVLPRPQTALMHVQYMLSDLASCGLGVEAMSLYNTAEPDDPVLYTIEPGNARPGLFSGQWNGPGPRGHVTTEVAEDGAVSITWRFPYAALRHLQDPYQRGTPGGFFEPQHFHLELEVIASASPDAAPPPQEPAKPEPPVFSPDSP